MFLELYKEIIFHPNGRKYPDLTLKQEATIRAYIGSSYEICSYMRNNCIPQNELYNDAIRTVTMLIKSIPPKTDITLYRGTRIPNHVFTSFIESNSYVDNAFLSFSDNKNGAELHMHLDGHENHVDEYKRVMFTLIRSHSGRDISLFSNLQSLEGNEYLFLNGTKFTILEHACEIKHEDTTEFEIHHITIEEFQ